VLVFEDAEDLGGENLGNGAGHAGEALHEEVDWVPAVEVERRASALPGVGPRVEVIEPADIVSRLHYGSKNTPTC